MTRIKISAGILLTLIAASIFSSFWIRSKCDSLLDTIETVIMYSENGDTENAVTAAHKLYDEWNKFRKGASVLVKNDKLSEIDRINARISFLIENGSDELDSEITELKIMIIFLKNGETPVLTSVL